MGDFQHMTDKNNLVGVLINGSFFTWCNGRFGKESEKKKHDRIFCNYGWLTMLILVTASTLPKFMLDHFPIL